MNGVGKANHDQQSRNDGGDRLTDQLLAYSGGASTVLETLDISGRISEIENLLRRLLPKNAALELRLAGNLPSIGADTSRSSSS